MKCFIFCFGIIKLFGIAWLWKSACSVIEILIFSFKLITCIYLFECYYEILISSFTQKWFKFWFLYIAKHVLKLCIQAKCQNKIFTIFNFSNQIVYIHYKNTYITCVNLFGRNITLFVKIVLKYHPRKFSTEMFRV